MSALASGLRVQTAADDPSGLAISQNIQAKVNGLQQSVQNVQTANNLLSTADATLDTVQRILSRIHSLIVQSRSDLKSNDELQGIQSEIDSLLQEINKISSEANFNGIKLFAGNSGGFANPNVPTVTAIPSEPNPDGTPARSQVYDWNNSGGSNPGDLIQNARVNPGSDVQSSIVTFRVLSYSNNPIDPQYGALGQPGVLVEIKAYSQVGAQFGAAPLEDYVQAIATGQGVNVGATEVAPSGGASLLNFDLANLSPQDVGVAMTFLVQPPQTSNTSSIAGGPQTLSFNDSGTEGGANTINLPALNTNVLQISGISVLDPAMVDHYTNSVTGMSSSNQYSADFAEERVSSAQDQLSFMRAQLGAQTVSLNADANDASIAIVNETSAMSSIRDTNIAATSIELTKDQILTQFGTSVLAQMQANQQQLMSLMIAQSLH